MFKRIAIMGTGSLGTILGAYLGRAGVDITVIDIDAEHVKALNEKGATVCGFADFTAPVTAMLADRIEGKFDLMIYMAKQTYNDVAIPQMVAALEPDGIICCCQNGIPEYEVAKYWPASQICGAPVGWGATWKGPGLSELTSTPDILSFHLGALDGKDHPWLYDVKEVLEKMCPVVMSENLEADRWSKVVMNSAWSGMSTVTGDTFGAVTDDDKGIICLTFVTKECVEVCNAAGVKMVTFSGVDWYAHTDFKDAEGQKAAHEYYRTGGMRQHAALLASMLQDLQKGRKCEISKIDGVVAETGDKYGVDTPFIDKIIEVVSSIERGERTYCWDNIKEFDEIIEKYSYIK